VSSNIRCYFRPPSWTFYGKACSKQSAQKAKLARLMGKAKAAAAEATVVVVAERQNVEQVITHYTSVEAELAAANL